MAGDEAIPVALQYFINIYLLFMWPSSLLLPPDLEHPKSG
jgi:hypothetical protein